MELHYIAQAHAARQIAKDIHEHQCNPLGTYLTDVVKGQVDRAVRREGACCGECAKGDLGLPPPNNRNRRVDENKVVEENGEEDGKIVRNRVKEILLASVLRAIMCMHRTSADSIARHAREWG